MLWSIACERPGPNEARSGGFKANYFDVETGEEYWISGCHRDGKDALYATDVDIDDDSLDEYWVHVRGLPENKTLTRIRVPGKYSK